MKKLVPQQFIFVASFLLLVFNAKSLSSAFPQIDKTSTFIFFALMVLAFIVVPAIILLKLKDKHFPHAFKNRNLSKKDYFVLVLLLAAVAVGYIPQYEWLSIIGYFVILALYTNLPKTNQKKKKATRSKK